MFTLEQATKAQSRNSTLPSTSALDKGGWSTPRPGRFTLGKDPVPIVQEAGWALEPFWTGAENPPPDPRSFQPVASRYIDCAMPDHQLPEYVFILTQLVILRASEACKLQRKQRSFENRSPWKEKYFHTVFLPILQPLND
jgi:hypothetical protein